MAGLAGACSEDVGTSVRISLVYKDGWRMSEADVIAVADGDDGQGGEEQERMQLERRGPISHELLVLVPDALAGNVMPLEVWGVRVGDRIAHGSAVALVRKGETVEATIVLDRLPCGVFCDPGELQCKGIGVETCEEDEDGCLQWSEAKDCPSETPFCSGGVCGISCADECAPGEGTCVDDKTARSCGPNYDNDACQDFGPEETCAGLQVCYSGRCALPCTHGTLSNLTVPGSTSGFTPVVAVDAAGGVHAVYSEPTSRALRYGFRTKTGTWPSTWDLVGAAGENPSLLVDKAGGIHVMAGGSAVVYAYRPPATTTWQVSPPLETGTAIGVSSSLAIGDDGVLHAAYHRASDNQLRYATKAGTTWTVENAGDPSSGLRCDLVMVGNTPHIAAFDPRNDIFHSTKGDTGWTRVQITVLTGASVQSIAGASIAADRKGTLHLIYSDFSNTFGNMLQYVYRPKNGSWTNPILVDDNSGFASTGAVPELAIDPFDRLHAVYRTTTSLVLRYATKDKGTDTWSLAMQPPNTSGVTPSIAIDSLGNVHILSAVASSPVIETTRTCQ